ncbi:hypothetical protein [Leptospira meyeri]|uniref:hypothetical protein n=1 Tax=Leptospira meyeri TaxID=29508 RepID=UPI0010825CF0|nr:hypothetical protein [Leptospira meyeri]TGM22011.1 hypothetical protein EHQ73_09455 [Leptospira meyeri]
MTVETNEVEKIEVLNFRVEIGKLVREYHKVSNTPHQCLWNQLYDLAKLAMHRDYALLSKSEGKAAIQIVEDEGRLEELYDLAKIIFNPSNITTTEGFLDSLEAMKSGG